MKKTVKVLALCLLVSLTGFTSIGYGQDDSASETVISIEDATICRDIVDRTPIDPGDVFTSDAERLFCFTRVVGAQQDIDILHNWYYNDQQVASVPLTIRSVNYRTYSSKRIQAEWRGEWRVEIVGSDGTLLEKIIFMVQ